jgi:hypothetical protein
MWKQNVCSAVKLSMESGACARGAMPYHRAIMDSAVLPLIVFGAFDRHNFGDMLLAHVAAAMRTERPMLFAGLAERDLRDCGGHRVKSIARMAKRWCGRELRIVHAGGELLTCSAWEAAVMLLEPEPASDAVACGDTDAHARLLRAQARIGMPALAPYVLPRTLFGGAASITHHAVGGVDLDTLDAAMRDEILRNLRAADSISVRDRQTRAHLAAAGISARLIPDPAAMTAALFGPVIDAHRLQGEPATVAQSCTQGYLAVQFSTDFDDDRTLDMLAAGLDTIAARTGLGIVFFRAGAAPWHDDLAAYERIAPRMRSRPRIFRSLHLWDICALVAGCRAYAGSSLHGRIVAMAHGLPRVNLRDRGPGMRMAKQAAYAATWDLTTMPGVVGVDELADALDHALAADRTLLRTLARELEAAYRRGCADEASALAPL